LFNLAILARHGGVAGGGKISRDPFGHL
jgi:hypothetical protein